MYELLDAMLVSKYEANIARGNGDKVSAIFFDKQHDDYRRALNQIVDIEDSIRLTFRMV